MLSNQTHVQQKRSQYHHRQDWDIHWLKIGCQERIQYGLGTIYVPNDGIWQGTIIRVDGPGIKQSQIYMQIQLTKINWTSIEPPTWHLLVWHFPLSVILALCIWRRIFFKSSINIKRGITLLSNHFSRFGLKIHISTKKSSKTDCILFLYQVSLTHVHYLSLTSPTPPRP